LELFLHFEWGWSFHPLRYQFLNILLLLTILLRPLISPSLSHFSCMQVAIFPVVSLSLSVKLFDLAVLLCGLYKFKCVYMDNCSILSALEQCSTGSLVLLVHSKQQHTQPWNCLYACLHSHQLCCPIKCNNTCNYKAVVHSFTCNIKLYAQCQHHVIT